MGEFSADFSVIPNHFHDELQKSVENSSVCVVSGNTKYLFLIIQMFCIELFLNNFLNNFGIIRKNDFLADHLTYVSLSTPGRVFATVTRNMFGFRSLVKRFREFGRAAMTSLFWPNMNRSLWSVNGLIRLVSRWRIVKSNVNYCVKTWWNDCSYNSISY